MEECVEPDTDRKQRGKPEKLNKQRVIVGRVEVHQKGNGNEAKQYQKAIGHSAILAGSFLACTVSGGLPPGISLAAKIADRAELGGFPSRFLLWANMVEFGGF
jgi:hypothetical protein